MKLQKFIYPLVAFALIILFLLAACTPQSATQTPVVSATETPAAPAVQHVLNVLHPQAPTTLNPHLSRSVKDLEPARIVYEPLAVFSNTGDLVPILAVEIPSLKNGELAADGKSVVWKLRQDVNWSDGKPFTADDVVFTYAYIIDPAVKAGTASNYSQVDKVEAQDNFTVKITFKDATPAWAVPFVGNSGVILPRHIFEAYKGENAATAPANTMPVGTGPYRVIDPGIKPQEVLLLGSQVVQTNKIVFEPNTYYRFPEKQFFQKIVWRGGGTADEAARLSLQVGSVDLAYDLDFVDTAKVSELLANKAAKGKQVSVFGAAVERLYLNFTDPNTPSADQEYSSLKVPHPLFSDIQIREAIAYAINREAIAKLYGENGLPTYDILVSPPQYKSPNVFYQFDLDKAKALLEEVGWVDTDGDGFREKDGIKMKIVFQSAVNTIQQQVQKLVQQDLKTIGIDTELKIIDSSIILASGASNPSSAYRFGADLMILRWRSLSPDPKEYMDIWTCKSIPQKANNWTGNNFSRWCNPAYDALFQQANQELDPAKRQQMFIQLNDILTQDVVMIPTVWRAVAMGVNKNLAGLDPTPWDSITWNIQDWSFATP